jgi:hypothetical protein
MMRIYCDACDRDISSEPRLVVEVPLGRWPPTSKVKSKMWEWCLTCAKAHAIEIEEHENNE